MNSALCNIEMAMTGLAVVAIQKKNLFSFLLSHVPSSSPTGPKPQQGSRASKNFLPGNQQTPAQHNTTAPSLRPNHPIHIQNNVPHHSTTARLRPPRRPPRPRRAPTNPPSLRNQGRRPPAPAKTLLHRAPPQQTLAARRRAPAPDRRAARRPSPTPGRQKTVRHPRLRRGARCS